MSREHDYQPGRRAVAELLIAPLEADGMRRKSTVTVATLEKDLERLKDRLAYAEPDTLRGMVPIVRGMAEGVNRDCWPPLLAIVNLAHAMQVPPDRSDEILWSWFHSRAGVAARNRGTVLAERAYIRRFRRPPILKLNAAGRSRMLDEITEHQRALDRDAERIRREWANGEAPDSELDWLRSYEATVAAMDAIIDAGIAHRRAQAEAEGEAA